LLGNKGIQSYCKLQELNQLIAIELLTSNFLENFGSCPNFQRGANARFDLGADLANKVMGAISVIFGSHVSLRVHHCKRDEVHFTTLL